MARREVFTCDRCKKETPSIFPINLGKDLTKPYEKPNDKAFKMELCKTCWSLVFLFCRAPQEAAKPMFLPDKMPLAPPL